LNRRAYLALVHHPTLDRTGKVVTTAITTLDMHDLARLARTYGLGGVFIQTNLPAQAKLAGRLLGHWVEGFGSEYNPHRREALEGLSLVESIGEAVEKVAEACGGRPRVLATSARDEVGLRVDFGEARRAFLADERPLLVLFGTGWGLAPEALSLCDGIIEPIGAPSGYNHLSVRSAASIIVDRLFGQYSV